MRWTEAEVWQLATSMGLDPFPTEFHTVPAHVLYDVAARGIPGRYSYWGHGKEFFHEIARHDHGLGRIYELVINSNPSHAFLLDVNSDVINVMVMTHVLGHTDFFKHNRVFGPTDRSMPNHAVLRAERIRGYEERHGLEAVEATLDALLSVEFYVDPGGYDPVERPEPPPPPDAYDEILSLGVERPAPPAPDHARLRRFAGLPCRDLLAFFIAEAPLADWQRDLAQIVREDGLYFWPQIRTKTLNEGWASLWHGKMMHRLDLTDGEFMEFARVNAGVVSAHPGALNPYWLGLKLLQEIERHHGLEKLFEIRRLETDATFIRNWLSADLVEELGLVRYGAREEKVIVTEDDCERVRDGIANDFAVRFPVIEVADKDYDGKGGLLLIHRFDGRPLKRQSALKVLAHLQRLWRRPVHLQTEVEAGGLLLSHNGREAAEKAL